MSKIFEGIFNHSEEILDEDLRKWFKEKWVRFGPDGKIRGDCARGDDSEGKPKCLPQAKAHSLGKKGRKYAASKKRREDPDPERKGAAKNVATKKKTSEAANPAQQSAIAIAMKQAGKKPKHEDIEGVFNKEAEAYKEKLLATMPFMMRFLKQGVKGWSPSEEQMIAAIETGYNVMKRTGDVNQAGKALRDELNTLHRMSQDQQDLSEEQLDELKCWPGYTRVQGVPAGAPGSCKKKTNERVQGMDEGKLLVSVKKWAAQVRQEHGVDTKFWNDKTHNRIIARKDKEIVGSYDRKANNGTVFSPEQDAEFNGDLDSKGRFTKDTVQKMFGKLSPDAKNIKEEKCPHCGGELVSEELMNEKQDACYHKVKSRYKVWPSAYASGALVKCRKVGAKNWGNKSESAIMRGIQSEGSMISNTKLDTSKFKPGTQLSHGLLGTVTVVRIDGDNLIVTDEHGKEFRLSFSSVK